MKPKPLVAHGKLATWAFYGTASGATENDPVVYHQMAPQLFDPVIDVAPFLVAAAQLHTLFPITVNGLHGGPSLPVPGIGASYIRFRDAESVRATITAQTGNSPPVEPVTRFDSLLWLFWGALKHGPYRVTRGVGRRLATDRPAGAAYSWRIVDDTGKAPLLGFTAYDVNGNSIPYLTVSPCPAEEFDYAIRTDSTISALAGL